MLIQVYLGRSADLQYVIAQDNVSCTFWRPAELCIIHPPVLITIPVRSDGSPNCYKAFSDSRLHAARDMLRSPIFIYSSRPAAMRSTCSPIGCTIMWLFIRTPHYPEVNASGHPQSPGQARLSQVMTQDAVVVSFKKICLRSSCQTEETQEY